MSAQDQLIVRCWSAVVARGEAGTPADVRSELTRRGTLAALVTVEERLRALRAQGALP